MHILSKTRGIYLLLIEKINSMSAYTHTLPPSVKIETADNFLLKNKKKRKRYNEQPTHKTTHSCTFITFIDLIK